MREEDCTEIADVWILEEDYVNPSGDGIEPVSAYQNDPYTSEEELEDILEEVVFKKGTVLLSVSALVSNL